MYYCPMQWALASARALSGPKPFVDYEVTRGRMRGFVPLDFKIRRILLPIENLISLGSQEIVMPKWDCLVAYQ